MRHSLCLLLIVHLQEAMAHSQSDGGRAIGIRSQCLFVEGQRPTKVLFIESDACFAEQRRDIRRRLVEDEIELGIGLLHFITLEQTKVCSTQKMVLNHIENFN